MNLAILGITGTLGAGKGTIVKHLERKGYRHFSVRQAIIEGLKSEGIEKPLAAADGRIRKQDAFS